MAESFSREHMKLAVAKTLNTLGWHSINTTPLEVLTDILVSYVKQLAETTNVYANEFCQTEPNLDHLGLAFNQMGVNLQDLEEYVTYVNFGPPPAPVPKFPIAKESHLNFLKPGSKEVVTRPVHIHEHLPPMYPVMEGNEAENEAATPQQDIKEENDPDNSQVFKKPAEVSPSDFKRAKEEESSRPTREISSVMMTTSGFLSPAREGKLPESRTPIPPPVEPVVQPPPPPPPPLPENVEPLKKPVKLVKKLEKKREKVGKELFKPLPDDKKKLPIVKDFTKLKQKNNLLNNLPNGTEVKISQVPMPVRPANQQNKTNKTLAAARLKTEKLNTTITPIPMKNAIQEGGPLVTVPDLIDKLLTEPDRKKLNNLKKIFNVKDIKGIKKEDKMDSREGSPGLVIDMPSEEIVNKISSLPCDVTIEPINIASLKMSNSLDDIDPTICFDGSPPGTPSAPKTPEIMTLSPPVIKEKRKRKVKGRRLPARQHLRINPECLDRPDRPRTPGPSMHPEGRSDSPFSSLPLPLPYPFATFGGPGLIPPPLLPNPLVGPNPMFGFNIPQIPYMPPVAFGNGCNALAGMPLPNFMAKPSKQALKMEGPPSKVQIFERPAKSTTPTIPTATITQPNQQEDNDSSPLNELVDVVNESPPPHPIPRTPTPTPVSTPPPPPPQVPLRVPTPTPTSTPPTPPPATPVESLPSTSAEELPVESVPPITVKPQKKLKEHKKEKKDKLKKKNKKDKMKSKAEKKKLKIEKKEKEKIKKEKKEKKKGKEMQQQLREGESPVPKITLKLGSPASRPATPEMKKLNIKPIVRKDDEYVISSVDERKRETSPGLAKISALVTGPPKPKVVPPTPVIPVEEIKEEPSDAPIAGRNHPGPGRPRIHPLKQKLPVKPKKRRTAVKKDAAGNEVWICPACGNQDDGSPMIGCDDCDAWYHWVCVGIRMEPDENENWYCRHCLMKKNETLQSDKKKKRKKREKKEH